MVVYDESCAVFAYLFVVHVIREEQDLLRL